MTKKNKIFLSTFVFLIVGLVIFIFGFMTWEDKESQSSNKIEDFTGNDLERPKYYQYKDLVRLETPLPEDEISSPLVIKGEARGTWFFEADFPVIVVNWDGLIIAQGVARAQDDWMTEDYVPFEATLEFETDTSVSNRGGLILLKDNPSDILAHDDALELTVYFK